MTVVLTDPGGFESPRRSPTPTAGSASTRSVVAGRPPAHLRDRAVVRRGRPRHVLPRGRSWRSTVAAAQEHHHVALLLEPVLLHHLPRELTMADRRHRAGRQPVRQGRVPAGADHPRHRASTQIEDLNVTSPAARRLRGLPHRGRQQPGRGHRHPEEHRLRLRPRARRRLARGVPAAPRPALRRRLRVGRPAAAGRPSSTPGQRIVADGAPHDHAFVRTGTETRTARRADGRRRRRSCSPGSRTARC